MDINTMLSSRMIKALTRFLLCSVGLITLFVTRTVGVVNAACPQGWWVIPNERCVKVFPDKKTLEAAEDICRHVDSELLSANQDVLEHYISPIITSMSISQVLLGVTDPWDTGVFLWQDGSLFDDSMWADHNPQPSGGRCAVFRNHHRGLINVNCSVTYAFICQKSRGFTGCYNAWYFGKYLSTVVPLRTHALTLQVCVQVCRGQHVNVGAVWRGQCYCFTNPNVPLSSMTYTRRCYNACPGSKGQRCGDVIGQYITVLDVGLYEEVAGSCTDLYRQGVRIPGPYLLHRDEDSAPSTRNCYYTDLQVNAVPRLEYAPKDWVYWRGNFYQFVVSTPNVFSVYNGGCFNEGGGYLTSVLSPDELDFIATTIQGSPFFAPVDQWVVGLTDVTLSGSLRWADPVLFDNNPSFTNLCTATTLCCVVRRPDSAILRDCATTPNTTWGYICKQEHGFRGCRKLHLTSMELEHIVDTDDMTALSCKELCRGILTELAVVSGDDCYCVTEIPASVDVMTPDHCNTSCSGHKDQMCAGGDFGLWYDVDADKVEDVELATDCDQFLYNGISTLDTVLLRVTQDNGQETLTQAACGIETDLETTHAPSTFQTQSPTSSLSLSKHEGVIRTDSFIQDFSELRLESVSYTFPHVSRSLYISTSTLSIGPTSTLVIPGGTDLSTPLNSEPTSDTIRGLRDRNVLSPSPVWADLRSSKPTNPQSPDPSSVGFRPVITNQQLVTTIVGTLREHSVSDSPVIGKDTQTPMMLTSMVSPVSEAVHITSHPDTPYPILTSSFNSIQATSGLTTVYSVDTGTYSEITSSSTTGNGYLPHKSSVPVTHAMDVESGHTGAYSEITSSSTTGNGYLPHKSSVPVTHAMDVESGHTGAYSEITSSSTADKDYLLLKTSQEVSYIIYAGSGDTEDYLEITSSSTTDNDHLLPKTSEPASHIIDFGSGDTETYSDITSSSATDNGYLLPKTSEPASPSSAQYPSDTTVPVISSRSYIHTCSPYYSEDEANSCPCLKLLTNALTSSCQATPGTSVVLTCRMNWNFTGGQSNITVLCKDGRWTPEPQHCVPAADLQITSSELECIPNDIIPQQCV